MGYEAKTALITSVDQVRGLSRYPGNDNAIARVNPKRWPKRTCYLYVIYAEASFAEGDPAHGHSMFKIGISENPWSRCNELQTGCPHKLRVYRFWGFPKRSAAAHYEMVFHNIFNETRKVREWFLDDIEGVCREIDVHLVGEWEEFANGFSVELLEYMGRSRTEAHEFMESLYREAT
jgi:hypothetical protein